MKLKADYDPIEIGKLIAKACNKAIENGQTVGMHVSWGVSWDKDKKLWMKQKNSNPYINPLGACLYYSKCSTYLNDRFVHLNAVADVLGVPLYFVKGFWNSFAYCKYDNKIYKKHKSVYNDGFNLGAIYRSIFIDDLFLRRTFQTTPIKIFNTHKWVEYQEQKKAIDLFGIQNFKKLFQCDNCGIYGSHVDELIGYTEDLCVVSTTLSENYFTKKNLPIYNLTCDEIIIKNILI